MQSNEKEREIDREKARKGDEQRPTNEIKVK